jgi:superfamily II DNA helicase RecQ
MEINRDIINLLNDEEKIKERWSIDIDYIKENIKDISISEIKDWKEGCEKTWNAIFYFESKSECEKILSLLNNLWIKIWKYTKDLKWEKGIVLIDNYWMDQNWSYFKKALLVVTDILYLKNYHKFKNQIFRLSERK